MTTFREFLQQINSNDQATDVKKTLNKLPSSHSNTISGFNWKFHPGNTLNGDDEHVGYMDDGNKEIAVAAPWNYSREMTALHEIAHKIWEKLNEIVKKQWVELVTKTNDNPNNEPALKQGPEELFCMAYASTYAKHPPVTYYKEPWIKFIKNLPN